MYEERYHDWYYGFAVMEAPENINQNKIKCSIKSYSMTGNISTRHYGKWYKPDMMKKELFFAITIYVPNYIISKDNYVTLHLNIEKKSTFGGKDFIRDIKVNGQNLLYNQTTAYIKFTYPKSSVTVLLNKFYF